MHSDVATLVQFQGSTTFCQTFCTENDQVKNGMTTNELGDCWTNGVLLMF